MADNFKTTDRTPANVDLAAKDVGGGVLVPRSILTKADGLTDINPSTEEKQDAGNASLASLVAALADPATETTLADVKTAVEAIAVDPATATLQGSIATLLSAISAKLPAALGSTSDSGSLSVAQSTEGKAAIGATNETAPASDTASSGLNGRMQRIAQRITSLIAAIATAPTNATSTAYEASRVIKASAGTLFGISGYNSKSTGQFLQLHDASSMPSDTAVPKVVLYIQPESTFSFDFGIRGRAFDTGIVVCNSSTGATKTIGSADCWFDAQYN